MCGVGVEDIGIVFFFKQKTAYEMRISDWSSDVCSSDLTTLRPIGNSRTPPRWPPASRAVILARSLSSARLRGAAGIRVMPGATGCQTDGCAGGDRYSMPRSKIGRASCRERVCQYV